MLKNIFTIRALTQRQSSPDVQKDCQLIIAHVLQKQLSSILAHPEQHLSMMQFLRVQSLLRKRQKNVPLAYILGEKEFFGRDFVVTKDVLVPRPETEILVEKVLEHSKDINSDLIVDIGTGSGCIAITMAKELKNTETAFVAVDISQEALRIAEKNARNHDVAKRIAFRAADLLANDALQKKIRESSDVIFAVNLPYVDMTQKESLLQQQESKALAHEPAQALWSKKSGLAHYERLISQTKNLNKKHIRNFYEIDPDQTEQLATLIHARFPDAKITFHNDLSGRARVCEWS